MDVEKFQRVLPFSFFGIVRLSSKKKFHKSSPNSPILGYFEVLLLLLSLGYGADFRRSRLVKGKCDKYTSGETSKGSLSCSQNALIQLKTIPKSLKRTPTLLKRIALIENQKLYGGIMVSDHFEDMINTMENSLFSLGTSSVMPGKSGPFSVRSVVSQKTCHCKSRALFVTKNADSKHF